MRFGGNWGFAALAACYLVACQKFADGSECPAGTSFKRVDVWSPPATKELCVDDAGKAHGPYRIRVEKDPLKSGTCEHGVAVGKWTTYSPDGAPQRTWEVSGGKIHGEVFVYSGGQTIRHGHCERGVATGVWDNPRGGQQGTYDASGTLVSGKDVESGECNLTVSCGVVE